jgi:drug/metabolite transporter (DMT)-like permease
VGTEHRLRGIAWMLATMLCFISLDAVMKYALQTYPLVQVTWARFLFATLLAAVLCKKNLPEYMYTKMPLLHVRRSLFLMVTTGLFNAGIVQMPLASATSIMFLSPILVTLLSIFLLAEHVGIRRWMSIIVGFSGALIIVAPWSDASASQGTGPLFLLAAALTNALYQITTRQLRGDHHLTTLLYTASAGAIITSLIVPWHWQTPDAFGWLLLVSSGVIGCVGHLCIIKAFQSAPASVIAPFSYSSLIWATLFGFVIWQEFPGMNTWIGASLIILAGLYIFFREKHLQEKAAA